MSIRLGIIGGGAAGLFAACQLKRLKEGSDIEVTVIDRNPVPGKKLILTGHGRCNITNRKDASVLKKCYHEAEKFIYPALKEFGPEDTMAFVENELGLKLKEEENNRIFPVCDSAVRVRDAVVCYITDTTEILRETKVTNIRKADDFEVITDKGTCHFDQVILSCGGNSFTHTGSSGDSYKFAKRLGHTVNPVKAALAPVRADESSASLCQRLSGVSLNTRVSVFSEDKKISSFEGDTLFADFGLTGPAPMEISREIPSDVTGKKVCLELDLVPSMSDEAFDSELQELIGAHSDTKIVTLLSRYVPSSVASEIAHLADSADMYAQGFPKDRRKKICRLMKHLHIGIDRAPDLEKAYVTRGGVSLNEVDRKTMESKIVPGLYIIGEALDIDGISGGYNLQACMGEAYLAAKEIIKRSLS
ncbi:MAG: aminoacetone oxidase family FAD-binding enzyme [Saccharofermentans sp.]|nr:aminoacetone oxidase family FAD-binding enzyme [Saccharofermentans sp.]